MTVHTLLILLLPLFPAVKIGILADKDLVLTVRCRIPYLTVKPDQRKLTVVFIGYFSV